MKEKEDKWEMFRSFFLAVHGKTQIEFQSSSLFNNEHFLQGKFKNFDFTIKEFKVFKGQDNNEREMTSEEQFYIDSLNNMKSFINNTPISKWASNLPILQGIPMSPFPKYQRCLGIIPINGHMEILDRYVRISFNTKLEHADEGCLFNDNFEKEET